MSGIKSANNEFTTGLYQALFPGTSKENLIFSPFSLHAALGMVGVGARGTTRSEILTALKIKATTDIAIGRGYNSVIKKIQSGSSPETFTLLTANRIYGQTGYNLNESFVKLLWDHFHADLEQLDFSKAEESARRINKWVASTTKNKIKDLISEGILNSETRLVLVNAIYLKGLWEHQFNPTSTTKKTFQVTTSKKIKVDMMHMQRPLYYADLPELDAAAVALPFKGDRLSMIIILPKAVNGLPKIQSSIGSIHPKGKSIFRQRSSYTEVQLSLPKFKIESTIANLKEVLQSLGMNEMFSERYADFSGMIDVADPTNPGVYVSTVIQKAFIEVNEQGAKAAAASAVRKGLRTCCTGPPKPVAIPFIVDHPFYFQIVGHANGQDMILFSGHCNDPTN